MICKLFVYFIIFSMMGWIYECIFTIASQRHWDNRGFLFGPVIPIYGFGGVGVLVVMDAFASHNIAISWWELFLMGAVGSFLLEYSTHFALEKLFHAYWWDYSNMPLNIKGRVCLPFTLCFGGAAILVDRLIIPFCEYITQWITPTLYEVFALIFMAILAFDTAFTVSILSDFSRKVVAADDAFNRQMEKIVMDSKAAIVGMRGSGSEESQTSMKDAFARYVSGLDSFGRDVLSRMKGFRNSKNEKESVQHYLKDMKEKVE